MSLGGSQVVGLAHTQLHEAVAVVFSRKIPGSAGTPAVLPAGPLQIGINVWIIDFPGTGQGLRSDCVPHGPLRIQIVVD